MERSRLTRLIISNNRFVKKFSIMDFDIVSKNARNY